MNNITFTQDDSNSAISQSIIDGVLRLRHETFIERLNWEITSIEGRERDQFDELSPFHIAVTNQSDDVVGCWRALPTTGAYMLESVFPELLQGEPAPVLDDVWEISRFAVKKGSADTARGYMGNITLDLVRSFHDFAIEHNIRSYVTVTTVACERMLRQLGVTLRRMGDGESMQIGKERSVALWISVDDNLRIVQN